MSAVDNPSTVSSSEIQQSTPKVQGLPRSSPSHPPGPLGPQPLRPPGDPQRPRLHAQALGFGAALLHGDLAPLAFEAPDLLRLGAAQLQSLGGAWAMLGGGMTWR